jgi:hypothetical protein
MSFVTVYNYPVYNIFCLKEKKNTIKSKKCLLCVSYGMWRGNMLFLLRMNVCGRFYSTGETKAQNSAIIMSVLQCLRYWSVYN